MPDLLTDLKGIEARIVAYTFERVGSQHGPTILPDLGRIYGKGRGVVDKSLIDEAVTGVDYMNRCNDEEKFENQKKYVLGVIARLVKSCPA